LKFESKVMVSRRVRAKHGPNAQRPDEGFGVIEAVVSIFLLGVLGILIAGGLIQNILANSRNVLIASASQIVTAEVLRIHSSVTTCEALESLVSGSAESAELILGETRIVSLGVEKVGWSICGELPSGAYPIRISASLDGEKLFEVDTLAVLR
jgi:hypothetical protein